jgi:hypothetical protein
MTTPRSGETPIENYDNTKNTHYLESLTKGLNAILSATKCRNNPKNSEKEVLYWVQNDKSTPKPFC